MNLARFVKAIDNINFQCINADGTNSYIDFNSKTGYPSGLWRHEYFTKKWGYNDYIGILKRECGINE